MKKESPIDPPAFAGWTFIVAIWYFFMGIGWQPYLIIAFIYLILGIGFKDLAIGKNRNDDFFSIYYCSLLVPNIWDLAFLYRSSKYLVNGGWFDVLFSFTSIKYIFF